MAGKPAEPASSICPDAVGRANAQPCEGEGPSTRGGERGHAEERRKALARTGPVAVIPLRKADGRSLILYSTDRERT
jgi:hypothetical protein